MIWSFSDSRTFLKCQRRWYYEALLAYWTQKDPARWEAYLLSKLQSVSAWRGQIVDSAITSTLVQALNRGLAPSLQRCLARARQLFDVQRAFALQHRLREEGMVPSQAGVRMAGSSATGRCLRSRDLTAVATSSWMAAGSSTGISGT